MESNIDNAQSDLLIKLNRLEDEVSTLTMQLDLNKETIAFLKTTLTERDRYIGDLEGKLEFAQKELAKTTLDKINDLRVRVRTNIDERLIQPVMGEIQRNVETLQAFVAESRGLIKQKQQILHEQTQTAIGMIQRCPDQAVRYLEQSIIEPTRFALHHISEQTAIRYSAVVQQLQDEVLNPGIRQYERLAHIAKELPSDVSVLFNMHVVEPLMAFVHGIPAATGELSDASKDQISQIIDYNRRLLQRFIDFLTNEIKKSPFWDGKNRAAAA